MEDIIEIEHCEQQLRNAMLNGDTEQLDNLLSDELIFINQDGLRLTKADDIAAHKSGRLLIENISEHGRPIIRKFGDTAIVSVTIEVTGKYAGQAFGGVFAYSRIWLRKQRGWQVELGHCSATS